MNTAEMNVANAKVRKNMSAALYRFGFSDGKFGGEYSPQTDLYEDDYARGFSDGKVAAVNS